LLTRIFVLLLAALVALPCVAVSGSRLVGGSSRTPIPQLAAFAPWAILGWLLVLILVLSARWWWIAVVVLVLIAIQLTWVLPTRGASAAAGDRPGSVAVRVMTVNLYIGAADLAEILRLVDRNDVDLLAVQEALPATVTQLTAGLSARLPHVLPSNPQYPAGTVIWSRWPITALGPSLGEGHQISRSLLQVPGAIPVTVTGVHTISPGAGPGRIDAWNRDLRALAEASRQTTGAQLMLGDFNATRDHQPFRRVVGTGLVDAAEAVRMLPWRGVTWPADRHLVPALVRLDHVLVTPQSIGVERLQVLPVAGTDHRAVLADLVFARG
jgi:endonuclease/exonuclease/phosphatase (EEP) superfamily protein YafD